MIQEEQKKEEFSDENWTNEEVKLLTKGIARYPPGTTQRWKVIADFVGTKSQKEAIKKAQEITEKRKTDFATKTPVVAEKPEQKAKVTSAPKSQQQQLRELELKQKQQKIVEQQQKVAEAPKAVEKAVVEEDKDGWTEEQ